MGLVALIHLLRVAVVKFERECLVHVRLHLRTTWLPRGMIAGWDLCGRGSREFVDEREGRERDW